jgi:hypothetical protein
MAENDKPKKLKKVMVTGEFVNMVPAHNRYIGKPGEGSTAAIAIGRAIDAIFADERVRGKRTTYPMKFTVTEYN